MWVAGGVENPISRNLTRKADEFHSFDFSSKDQYLRSRAAISLDVFYNFLKDVCSGMICFRTVFGKMVSEHIGKNSTSLRQPSNNEENTRAIARLSPAFWHGGHPHWPPSTQVEAGRNSINTVKSRSTAKRLLLVISASVELYGTISDRFGFSNLPKK